jgi:Flp pilus assembly CpaF family ATPase
MDPVMYPMFANVLVTGLDLTVSFHFVTMSTLPIRKFVQAMVHVSALIVAFVVSSMLATTAAFILALPIHCT